MSRKISLYLLAFLCLFVATQPILAHADFFQPYLPGVKAGDWMLYNVDLDGTVYQQKIVVNSIDGSAINYTQFLVYNGTNIPMQTARVDVSQSSGSLPLFFVAENLNGGPINPGNSLTLYHSFFGHIILGQWRQINYFDLNQYEKHLGNFINPGLVSHEEWDQATGIMTYFQDTYNGAGMIWTLAATNLWHASLGWVIVGGLIDVARIVVPIVLISLGFYLAMYIVFAIIDHMHVRKMRQKVSGKVGGMMWFQIKIMVIAMVIFLALFILVIFVLIPLISQGLSG